MACVFTSKLQVKLSSQFYSWSSITREETFRKFYRNFPHLNPFRLLTSLNSEPWTWQRTWRKSRVTVKTIEFWHLKVICITSERMLSSWHSPFKEQNRKINWSRTRVYNIDTLNWRLFPSIAILAVAVFILGRKVLHAPLLGQSL